MRTVAEPKRRVGRPTCMRRLAMALGLLMVPFLWLTAEPAAACSCVQRTVQEQLAHADAVVSARLLERRQEGQSVFYEFFGTERFKGDVTPGFEVRTAASGASCGLEGLVVGQRYVVFMQEEQGAFEASLCGGTRQVSATFVERVEGFTGPGLSFDLPPQEDPVEAAARSLRMFASVAWWG